MKTLFAVVILMLLFVGLSVAADVKMSWDDPNATSVAVTKYTVYRATVQAGPFTKQADVLVPTKTWMAAGLTPGTYYFYVTASNAWGESGPSNTLSTPSGTPGSPTNLIFIATVNPDGSYTLKMVDAKEFFRAISQG